MAEKKQTKRRSQWAEIWRRFLQNKGAVAGLIVAILFIVLACSVDVLFDYEAEIVKFNLRDRLLPPSLEHPFGTDQFGMDVFKRVIYGSKYSLVVGISCTVSTTIIALVLGAIAGYYGGKADNIIMRLCDIVSAIPSLLLGMIIVSVLGVSMINLIIALSVGALGGAIRVVRAAVLTVRTAEYVESARAIGMREWKVIAKYIIPNCMAPIIVNVTLRFASAVISASSLSFLGLGVPAPAPEWGAMLSAGRNYIRGYPHLTLYPGLAIMLFVLALNMVGDGLRDAMDPKLRR